MKNNPTEGRLWRKQNLSTLFSSLFLDHVSMLSLQFLSNSISAFYFEVYFLRTFQYYIFSSRDMDMVFI